MPVIDLAEVGAGGGSIARVDLAAPYRSAQKERGPSPAQRAMGAVGPWPLLRTPTSSSAIQRRAAAGRHDPARSPPRPEEAVDRNVAKPLGISPSRCCLCNPLARQCHHWARGAHRRPPERGRDVRRFTLLAAGGGGPGHAAEMARVLGIGTVVIPTLCRPLRRARDVMVAA